jgi:hypothetical protein
MLVVDRRSDQGAYVPGSNRAEVQAELDSIERGASSMGSPAVPAMVEVEGPNSDPEGSGVLCVAETPGRKDLLELLFKRVWGKEIS